VIVVTAIASVVLLLLAIIYFGVTLWVIKNASLRFFGVGLEANWAVMAADKSPGGTMTQIKYTRSQGKPLFCLKPGSKSFPRVGLSN